MNECVDTNENVTSRLEKIFYQAIDLIERQTQERSLIAKDKEDVSNLVSLLISQTKEIGQYEEGIRKRIQASIKESAIEAVKSIEATVMDRALKNIDERYAEIDRLIKSAQNEKSQSKLKFTITTIACGVLTGLFTVWILMPKAILPLTGEQLTYLQQGKALSEIWPKLSQAEKDKLKLLSKGVN